MIQSRQILPIQLLVQKRTEVFDCTNHLACVRILVVIPGNNLYQSLAVAHRKNLCLGSVEDGTSGAVDDIGGYDLVGVVLEGLGLLCFHLSINLLCSNLSINYSVKDCGGTGSYRNTLCSAVQLAVQLRKNASDCLCST